jgi:4-amino-4-deoxy-L-arabinose transferase-like glycosyltransferase
MQRVASWRDRHKSLLMTVVAGVTLENTVPPRRIDRIARDLRVRWLALLSAATVVLFLGADIRELQGIYVFYADIARNVAERDNFIVLRNGDDIYTNKPPLMFWLSGLTMKAIGVTSLAASLWSRVFGIGCVILTALVGRRIFGRSAGWLAGLVLLSTGFFLETATKVRMDTGLTFGVLLSFLGYLHGAGRWRGPLMFYGGLVIGLLVKGPIGLLIVPLVVVHAIVAGRWRWSADSWKWVISALLLLIPIAWYIAQIHHIGPTVLDRWLRDAKTSSKEMDSGRTKLASYYALKFIRNYWPWLPLVPVGLYFAVRAAVRARRPARQATAIVLLIWIIGVLAGAAWKNSDAMRYLVPALPALSLLVAWPIASWSRGRLPGVLIFAPPALAVLALVAYPFVPNRFRPDTRPKIESMKRLLDDRLGAGEPVAMIAGTRDTTWWNSSWCRFYLGRPAHELSAEKLTTLARRQTLLVMVPRSPAPHQAKLDLKLLASTDTFLLGELRATGKERGTDSAD